MDGTIPLPVKRIAKMLRQVFLDLNRIRLPDFIKELHDLITTLANHKPIINMHVE